ncbi:MAG: hypothetical protein QXL17_06160 [Candidatus Thermoplasmatota archaeon]
MNTHEEHIPDPEKIPGLLKEISSLLYGPESAKKYAQSAAIFFKSQKQQV